MTESPIQFRPVQDQDLAFLYRLYASTREQELAVTGWDETQKRAFLTMQFEAQHNFYKDHFATARFDLILLDGEPIGRIYVDRRVDEIRIIDIALVPAYRNRGIGGQLLRDLLDEAATAQLPVRIHVERLNPALGLYRRLGFEHVADNGVYYLMEAKGERNPPTDQVNTAS